MKIWIDLTNSPHVNFFAGLINELRGEHEVLLTCRPLANTVDLLEMKGFSYHIVGKHYGASRVKKAMGFFVRTLQLLIFLANKNIDVAISHSSFCSPVLARLLGARSIYLNDNEHAAGNKIAFLFADKIMVPECLNLEKVQHQEARKNKIVYYPGVKEGVYLWDYRSTASESPIHDRKQKKLIYVRPEPWTAQYYKGKRNFMDNLLIGLKDDFHVILLPRGRDQKDYYSQNKFSGVMVLEKSMNLADIMESCDLFIGAGGTMTREAVVLGIPTISIYQDKLLEVDKYLIKKGCMIHKPDLDAAFVVKFISENHWRPPMNHLLAKGQKTYDLIKKTLLERESSKQRGILC